LSATASVQRSGSVTSQVHVLGHHYITDNAKSVAASGSLQRIFEDALGFVKLKIRAAAITTKRYEVQMTGVLETDEPQGHGVRLCSSVVRVCDQ
jgi:hypothetical protein